MFSSNTHSSNQALIGLAIAASIALHAVAGAGVAQLTVPAPGSGTPQGVDGTPTVTIHIESVTPESIQAQHITAGGLPTG